MKELRFTLEMGRWRWRAGKILPESPRWLRTKLGQNPEVPTLLASYCSSGSVVVV